MSKHKRFRLKDLHDLREELLTLGLELPIDEDLSVLAEPVKIGPLTAPNRLAVHPMEGFDATPDGAPGELSFRRYGRYAQGGFGLIWFEATAVMQEARSNPGQLWLHEDNVDVYRRLVEQTRQKAKDAMGHNVVLIIQLTHAGRYSKPTGTARPLIAHHSKVLDPQHNLPPDYPLVTDDYLDKLQDTYVQAAALAARAGFDGVDVKSCHRYLVSELLASHTRQGKYGGTFEDRTRLLRETLARIADDVHDVFITTRMNVYDAIRYPYGFGVDWDDPQKPDLSEPIELIRQLKELGIELINVSIGNPYFNPHIGRPYDRPTAGSDVPDEHPLAGVVRFLGITRKIQQAFPDLPVIGGGYSWLRGLMPQVAAGVVRAGGATLVGQGRGAFAYPDSVRDILETGRMDPQKVCVACSGCTQIMRDGAKTGCVVRDSEIYGPQYRLGRRFAFEPLLEQARRCRACDLPGCSAGCPASVDIPAFIEAFAENDVSKAYDVLRQSNVLPEMCAYVCPAEVQCEGGCLERIFTACAIPVRDIQLVVSQIARREGYVGLRLPEEFSERRVAVVGGGPAGLACAIRSLEKGHAVTIIEKSDRLGGTPECIIPDARYDGGTEEIDAILEPAIRAGRVEIKLGYALGRDTSLGELTSEYDAVFLAPGLGKATSLGGADGVLDSLSFLARAKRGQIASIADRVAVLGGGNTAMDAATTAKSLGARDVFIVYRRSFAEMPAWPSERERVLAAGCHLLIFTQPLGYATSSDGKLTGLKIARTRLGEPDSSQRRRPSVIEGTQSVLDVDVVIEAIGLELAIDLREALAALSFTPQGLLELSDGSQATSIPGIFAGGDLVSGGTTAVRGISEGMQAAQEIDEYMLEYRL